MKSLNKHSFFKELFVSWGCGLFFGVSLFIPLIFIIGMAATAAATFGGFRSEPALYWVFLLLGLCAIFLSPMFLGSFWADFKSGISSGLIALPLGIFTFLVGWLLIGAFRYINFVSDLLSILPGIVAASTITPVILMSMKPFPRRSQGLLIGLVVGLGLSIVSGLTLGRGILASNNLFHFIWQIPPLVWVTVVYFVGIMRQKSGWKEFTVWAGLVAITFWLPFFVVPRFCLNCG